MNVWSRPQAGKVLQDAAIVRLKTDEVHVLVIYTQCVYWWNTELQYVSTEGSHRDYSQ
jgi:hypothetical protein